MNKKKVIGLSLFSLILILFVIILYGNKYKKQVYTEEGNNQIRTGTNISMMLETKAGSGDYELSTSSKWPTKGYIFNAERSKCENGGTLSWNDETKSVVLTTKVSNKCYVYFDIVPPDVSITATNLPKTYGKLGSLNCSNSTATYNQQYNRVEISQINGDYTSCTLNYKDSTSKVNLATYITGLSGKTQGTGQVVNEKGYRYEGKNPNNYVWFNNEYWRIIGVFDTEVIKTDNTTENKSLVKIIRADVLDGLAWDKSGTNDWTAASLNKLLNGAYYNAQDGTSSGYCYGHSTIATANCDYTKKGIQSGYRNMIANVTWYLGGYSSISATTESFYGYERGTTVYSGRPTKTTGYIGLMYPSDYGYSVLSSSCARTKNSNSYGSGTCAGQSWLYGKGHEWTITPNSSNSNNVYYLYSDGTLNNYYIQYINNAFFGYGVRPVLYLDASVYKTDGEGTLDKPYIIAD
jgi:hypothetical protein